MGEGCPGHNGKHVSEDNEKQNVCGGLPRRTCSACASDRSVSPACGSPSAPLAAAVLAYGRLIERVYGAQRLEARREKCLREAKWRFCFEKSFFFFSECFDKLRREALFLYSTDPTEEFGEEGLLTQNSFYPLPKKKKKILYKSGFKVGLGMSS